MITVVNAPDEDMQLFVISHTHWDREWYLPWEGFRFKLVYTIDKLLRILDEDNRFVNFTLDGQSVVLEDYLEIRPQNKDKIAKYLQEGRITAGPFYMLPDEFKVSPEAHVRNLLLGKQIVESFGAMPMPVGNLPDEFGHIAQMPQILQGFNIDNMIFSRGMGDEVDRLNSEFTWIAPDGKTSVLAINQPMGYGNMAGATRDKPSFDAPVKQAKQVRDNLKKRAATKVLLLMSGVDHLAPEELLPDFIEYFNALGIEGHMQHASFMGYLDALRAELQGVQLGTFTGGLQGGREQLLLSDIVSTRIYLLQNNLKNEALYERWTEPISAITELISGKQFSYPKDYVWYGWRWLLRNHPHDSIGGCSVDAVHRDMMTRFAHAWEVGMTLLKDAVRNIIARVDFYPVGRSPTQNPKETLEVLVFNPSTFLRDAIVNIWVETTELGEPTCPEVFRLLDVNGDPVPVENWRETSIETVYKHWKPFDAYYKFEFLATNVPALGFKTFYLTPTEDEPVPVDTSWVQVTSDGNTILETSMGSIVINDNGTFDLLDKETGMSFQGCGLLLDEPDFGDEYDYIKMPLNHQIYTSSNAAAMVKEVSVHAERVTATVTIPFELPAGLSPDRKTQLPGKVVEMVEMNLTLCKNSRRVNINIVVDNKAKDHRLRIIVPSGIITDKKIFQQHFCVLEKPLAIPEGKGWNQKPNPTEFHDHFFGVAGTRDGNDAGLVILSRDAQQHEVNEQDFGTNSLILTLFRSVGWLGRPGQGAGPDVATPDAQCLFKLEFNMAILPFTPSMTVDGQVNIPDEVFSNLEEFVNPILPCVPRTFNDFRNTEPLPAVLDYKRFDLPKMFLVDEHNEQFLSQEKVMDATSSFISMEPRCMIFSTFKKADLDDGYVLRFYNLSRETRDASITVNTKLGFASVEEVKLDEMTGVDTHAASLSDNIVTVKDVGHDEIVTLKFKA